MNQVTKKLFTCCSLLLGWGNFSATAQTAVEKQESTVESGSYPEVEKFAAQITSTIWDLRGTRSLKHLRYNGETWHNLSSSGKEGSAYESAFVDVGVVRLNFRGPTNGWYFFSDDLKWVTSLTVDMELVFAPAQESKQRPVKDFPGDLTGVVWELQPDEREVPSMKLRWAGSVLESGALMDGKWVMEKVPTVVAGTRVLEMKLPDDSVGWYVFSADGGNAWFLHLKDVYGGHAREVTRGDESASAPQGMNEQHVDEFHHALQLKAAGETGRMLTLKRYLMRTYADNEAVSSALERALK